jgi:hypothetical protein
MSLLLCVSIRKLAWPNCVCCCVQTCRAKDGDAYSTLAGTKLTVVKEAAAHKGRKLQQVGPWHAAACKTNLPATRHCGRQQVLCCRVRKVLIHTTVL